MILQVFLIFGTLQALTCFPQTIKIPEIKVSPPEEVNSLERDPVGSLIANSNENNNSIEDTIREVEDIIKNNPRLPRLTRGEILDIIENITTLDKKGGNVVDKNRDPKAIMVVMPYTPANDDNKSIEDLFTKPPVTQIINAEPFKPNKRRKNNDNLYQSKKAEASTTISTTTTPTTTTSARSTPRRRRPYSTTTTESTETTRPRTRRPVRRRTTTTTKHPNHRYPEEEMEVTTKIDIVRTQKPLRRRAHTTSTTTTSTTLSPGGLKIIDSPDLATEEDNTREVVLKQEFPVSGSKTSTYKTLIEEINLPIPLKSVAEDLNLETALKPQKPKPPPFIPEIREEFVETSSTTSTIIPDVSNVADSLSPEMRDLLKSFGLLPDPNAKPLVDPEDKFYPEKAEVTPDSYVGFKPLPENGPGRNEMESLLASFGLGRNARKQKSVNKSQKQGELINFDVVPEHLKGVLTDLGLSERHDKKINHSSTKQHIFNPDTNYATEEELDKLTKLLDMVKQLGRLNRTATEEDLKKIDMNSLKELLNSFNNKNNELTTLDETNGPDPNNYDQGLLKNEIKRQTSTTTEQSKSPSISDLEASFGGQTEVTEAAVPETTTARKRTGFYYLVDWNTFLDIDDQKGKRVNLRFQPTVGDPKRFLSVSVP